MTADPDAAIRSVLHIKRGDSLALHLGAKALVTRRRWPRYSPSAATPRRGDRRAHRFILGAPATERARLHMTCVDMWPAYDNHSAENQERAYRQACRRLGTTLRRSSASRAWRRR